MRYHALATDFDGTLAINNQVTKETLQAIIALKNSGRKVILVTGRRLDDLMAIFPEHTIFDCIVAENGALIYWPETMQKRLLAEPPPEILLNNLAARNVPVVTGNIIIAGWFPHEAEMLEAIRDSGLEYQVIFNKNAVMILPPAINKETGLIAALHALNISVHNIIAIGDAENDNAMLLAAECAVAVSNALPQVKSIADITTAGAGGDGVAELIRHILSNDMQDIDEKLSRHFISLGRNQGNPYLVSPYHHNLLLAGSSGSGKTTYTIAFLEQLIEKKYQFCLIDPEGDYQDFEGVMTIGDSCQPPLIEHVIKLLSIPGENAIVSLLGVSFKDRPAYFKNLANAVAELQKQTGHPHFFVMDEAHHLIPGSNQNSMYDAPENCSNFFAVTTNPDHLTRTFLKQVDIAISLGDDPVNSMRQFADKAGANIPIPNLPRNHYGDLLIWNKADYCTVQIQGNLPSRVLRRHKRKYAAGDMGPNSFYFRGPEGKLNLKANNLIVFIQMAEGIDDASWLYHLKRHDYSNWFRNAIKDSELAWQAEKVENTDRNPEDSRLEIFRDILARYTIPA